MRTNENSEKKETNGKEKKSVTDIVIQVQHFFSLKKY